MSYREQILKLNKLKKYDKTAGCTCQDMIKIWNEWSMYNLEI